ncbi:hypothetical protein AHF37_06600 [Paragonimus kellicotti]|nr:hypothetical protein AHF37_06600 [Paragonimus kellicotti]
MKNIAVKIVLGNDLSLRRIPHVCQLLDISKSELKAVIELTFGKKALNLMEINYMSRRFLVRVERIIRAGSNLRSLPNLMENVDVVRITSTAVMIKIKWLLPALFILHYMSIIV